MNDKIGNWLLIWAATLIVMAVLLSLSLQAQAKSEYLDIKLQEQPRGVLKVIRVFNQTDEKQTFIYSYCYKGYEYIILKGDNFASITPSKRGIKGEYGNDCQE